MKRFFGYILSVTFLTHCASMVDTQQRKFLDSTHHSDTPPTWVDADKIRWEEGEQIFFKSSHSVRGNERVNGCYDLARLDTKEKVLSEIENDIKGRIDNVSQGLSEAAEVALGKVRSERYSGNAAGIRFTDQYFERYFVAQTERVDCHVLGHISKADYQMLARNVATRVIQVDPRLKEAITQAQINVIQEDRAPVFDFPSTPALKPGAAVINKKTKNEVKIENSKSSEEE